jgi:FkbM family methyltransferase
MYAQHGEDLYLAARFDPGKRGTFVEVGAYNGVDLSNTCLLERGYGWEGVLVEANPELAGAARRARPGSQVVSAAAVAPEGVGSVGLRIFEGHEEQATMGLTRHFRTRFVERSGAPAHTIQKVEADTLDHILAETGVRDVDVVSIDVEGHEDAVLKGFSLGSTWKPTVMLVERCTPVPSLWSARYFFRAGYEYRGRIRINDWYEPGDMARRVIGLMKLISDCVPLVLRACIRGTLRRLRLLGTARRWRGKVSPG